MANTIATSPGTVVDDATVGTSSWTNPDNAKISDNVYATFPSGDPFVVESHYLNATNFGFSIPTGATINGIVVEIKKKETSASFGVVDTNVKIIKADGTKGTTNKALATEWPTTDTYVSYGSSSDLWGETWTPATINDIDFGIAISAHSKDTYGYIDHIRMTVYYTEVSASTMTGVSSVQGLSTITF